MAQLYALNMDDEGNRVIEPVLDGRDLDLAITIFESNNWKSHSSPLKREKLEDLVKSNFVKKISDIKNRFVGTLNYTSLLEGYYKNSLLAEYIVDACNYMIRIHHDSFSSKKGNIDEIIRSDILNTHFSYFNNYLNFIELEGDNIVIYNDQKMKKSELLNLNDPRISFESTYCDFNEIFWNMHFTSSIQPKNELGDHGYKINDNYFDTFDIINSQIFDSNFLDKNYLSGLDYSFLRKSIFSRHSLIISYLSLLSQITKIENSKDMLSKTMNLLKKELSYSLIESNINPFNFMENDLIHPLDKIDEESLHHSQKLYTTLKYSAIRSNLMGDEKITNSNEAFRSIKFIQDNLEDFISPSLSTSNSNVRDYQHQFLNYLKNTINLALSINGNPGVVRKLTKNLTGLINETGREHECIDRYSQVLTRINSDLKYASIDINQIEGQLSQGLHKITNKINDASKLREQRDRGYSDIKTHEEFIMKKMIFHQGLDVLYSKKRIDYEVISKDIPEPTNLIQKIFLNYGSKKRSIRNLLFEINHHHENLSEETRLEYPILSKFPFLYLVDLNHALICGINKITNLSDEQESYLDSYLEKNSRYSIPFNFIRLKSEDGVIGRHDKEGYHRLEIYVPLPISGQDNQKKCYRTVNTFVKIFNTLEEKRRSIVANKTSNLLAGNPQLKIIHDYKKIVIYEFADNEYTQLDNLAAWSLESEISAGVGYDG